MNLDIILNKIKTFLSTFCVILLIISLLMRESNKFAPIIPPGWHLIFWLALGMYLSIVLVLIIRLYTYIKQRIVNPKTQEIDQKSSLETTTYNAKSFWTKDISSILPSGVFFYLNVIFYIILLSILLIVGYGFIRTTLF